MYLVACAALESADDVLGRRLEESDDVGDELLLALDSHESLEILRAVDGLLYIGALEYGLLIGSCELLDDLCGSIADVAEHDGGVASEAAVELAKLTIDLADGLLDQRVLDNLELNLLIEAGLAESACLLGVEALDIDEVEVVVALKCLDELVEESSFIFFSHDSFLK